MKILIGSHAIFSAGGSEEHARTLAAEFQRRGHEVQLFATGMKQTPEHNGPAFLSHAPIVQRFLDRNPESRCIQTIHGLHPELERPVRNPRVQHVAVSREIADAYPDLDMPVIMNGVDLNRFSPTGPLPKKPRRLLCAVQSESLAGVIYRICEEQGIEFRAKNKFVNPTFEIEHDMQWADIVVGIGRTAIEAAACGKMVLLADHRPYQPAWGDGVLANIGLSDIQYHNYSGRFGKMPPVESWLRENLRLYHPMWGKQARKIAERYHDVAHQADGYMTLWEKFAP